MYKRQVVIGSGAVNTYGCLLFRSVEANLNYIEACYEKNGSLDPKAKMCIRDSL